MKVGVLSEGQSNMVEPCEHNYRVLCDEYPAIKTNQSIICLVTLKNDTTATDMNVLFGNVY